MRRRFATGMTYECVAVVTPPKFRVTRATAWGQLQGFIDFIKNWKTSAVSTTDGWLKLNFASCVMRQTRSLGALVLYSILVICCLWIKSTIWWLILSSTSFMVDRSLVFNIYSSWKIYLVGPWLPGCYQGQQDDYTRTMRSIAILRTDTIQPA